MSLTAAGAPRPTTLALVTQRREGVRRASEAQSFNYPLKLKIAEAIQADGSATQATTVAQQYLTQYAGLNGLLPSLRTITNEVDAADTLQISAAGAITGHAGQSSRQRYFRLDTTDGVYERQITAANDVLTGVSPQ